MSEESKRPENPGLDQAVRGQGGEGEGAAAGTQKIGEDAEKGKTTQPAPPDDVNAAEGEPSEEGKATEPHP
jgi:hypothetical protein